MLVNNRLHGKAAELCLANRRNSSVTTTKYIEYINSIHRVLLFLLCVYSYFYNERTNCLRVYKHLLTDHLHDKAAELCLAKS